VSLALPATNSEPRATARGSFSPPGVLCALLLVVLVAGCSGNSGRLTSLGSFGPDEILAGSLARLDASGTVHVESTLGGSINAGSLSSLVGGLPVGLLGSLKLDGATVTSDVDKSNRAVHLSASFPALFGAKAELLLVGGDVYTKVNLLGDKFTKAAAPPELTAISSWTSYGFVDALDEVRTVLQGSGATATLLGREAVGGRDAYHLLVTVPQAGLIRSLDNAGAAAIGLPQFEIGPLDYWVYADSLQPARLRAGVTSTSVGSVNFDATLSRYDQQVTIAAPPADQIKGG
jgi:hypothetical protein